MIAEEAREWSRACERVFAFESGAAPDGYDAQQFYEDTGHAIDAGRALANVIEETLSSSRVATHPAARAAVLAFLATIAEGEVTL